MNVFYSNLFKKNLKVIQKRGYNLSLLTTVIKTLASNQPLDPKYRDHQLKGDYIDYRECHIQPDWLLIYRIDNNQLILVLHSTGTHSDLFKK